MKLSMIVSLIALTGCAAGVDLPEDDVVPTEDTKAPEPAHKAPAPAPSQDPVDDTPSTCRTTGELVGNCMLLTTHCETGPDKLVVDCAPMGDPLKPGDYIPDPPPPWADRSNTVK